MRHICFGLLAAAVVLGLAWIAGFDFDKRGEMAFWVAYGAVSAGVVAALFSRATAK